MLAKRRETGRVERIWLRWCWRLALLLRTGGGGGLHGRASRLQVGGNGEAACPAIASAVRVEFVLVAGGAQVGRLDLLDAFGGELLGIGCR